jgi:hypothetical protein
MKNFGYITIVLLLLIGCKNDSASEINMDDLLSNKKEEQETNKGPQVSKEAFSEIMNVIPQPVEMASLIKESGVTYSEEMLNPTENREDYTDNYSKAVNLGIYGADLGYINMYNEFQSAIPYLTAVKFVADDLSIGQFFDFNTIKRLAMSSANPDSLMNLSTSGFENMDNYLREQNRSNISALILFGGWLESLYLSTQIVEQKKDKRLIERIGEQKIVINKIDTLLSFYANDPYFKKLADSFIPLKNSYDKVEIIEVIGEATMEEVDGMLMVIDNSYSETTVPDETLAAIISETLKLRSSVIN